LGASLGGFQIGNGQEFVGVRGWRRYRASRADYEGIATNCRLPRTGESKWLREVGYQRDKDSIIVSFDDFSFPSLVAFLLSSTSALRAFQSL